MLGKAANGILEAAVIAPRMPISATSLELISDSSNFANMMPMIRISRMNDRNAA